MVWQLPLFKKHYSTFFTLNANIIHGHQHGLTIATFLKTLFHIFHIEIKCFENIIPHFLHCIKILFHISNMKHKQVYDRHQHGSTFHIFIKWYSTFLTCKPNVFKMATKLNNITHLRHAYRFACLGDVLGTICHSLARCLPLPQDTLDISIWLSQLKCSFQTQILGSHAK